MKELEDYDMVAAGLVSGKDGVKKIIFVILGV